jgi:hypothetical protein
MGVAWADAPFPVPVAGGIVKCEAYLALCAGDLNSCDVALDTCSTDSATCDGNLSGCQVYADYLEVQIKQCNSNIDRCLATAQPFPATGQTTCWYYDGDGETHAHDDYVEDPDCINPASAGQDGDIQAGAELSYTDTGLTIFDSHTRLEWMKQDDNNLLDPLACDSYPGNLDKDCRFLWADAFAFVANLNANSHAGYTDWRVPNVKEMQSIMNYESVSDEFSTECLAGCTVDACSCTEGNYYWTSTTVSNNPPLAYLVSFLRGGVLLTGKRESGASDIGADHHVRAVRGGL